MGFLILIVSLLFGGVIFYVLYRVLYFVFNLLSVGFPKFSNEQLVVIKTYVAMAKLTPDYHIDNQLTADIRTSVRNAFLELLEFMSSGTIDSLLQEFDTLSSQGNTIKVKDLQKDLQILKRMDFSFKKEFLMGLFSIAYTNGNFDDNQENLLNIVRYSIGVTNSVYYKIQTMFWNRMRAGKFGDYQEFEKRRKEWYEREERKKNGGSDKRQKEEQQRRNESGNDKSGNDKKGSSNSHLSYELEKAYSVLELLPDASIEEINKQKKKLLKRYHPDLFQNQGESVVMEVTRKSQEINHAYDIIMKKIR